MSLSSVTAGKTHAWVTLLDGTPPTVKGRYTSMANSDTVSQTSGSVCSAKFDQESVSISSDDAILDFDPQTSPTKHTNFDLQHSVDDSGSNCSVSSESRLCPADRGRLASSNEYLERHNYEPIDVEDDQPAFCHIKPTYTHTSGQRPPAKVKANSGKELVTLVAKVPVSDTTNIDQPTRATPQQRTLLNTATPARPDYENHTLNFKQENRQVSFPPRSCTTAHAHGNPASPTVSSPPRLEVVFERTNFKRIDTPRTLLAKKLGKLQESSKTQNSVPEHPGERTQSANTATQRCDYENHALPFEHQSEQISQASLPPRSQTTTHSHKVRSPPPMATSPPGQETGVTERKDFSRLDTPRTLHSMKSGRKETTQNYEDTTLIPTLRDSTNTTEQPKVEEPHVRRSYENHSLKFEHQNKAADHVSLPPRTLTVTHSHERLLAQSTNNTPPRQSEPATIGERTDFSRLATPSTLKRLTAQQSGKSSSPTPDYVDEDYVNTSLLSMSGLPSPTAQSGSATAATPDYVDDDYINTALMSQSDNCVSPTATVTRTDSLDETDYVNTIPPTTFNAGARSLPSGEDGDNLVYDYPDLRNSRLVLSPKSRSFHQPLQSMKSDPLGNSRDAPIPARRTKRRAASDAPHTQHLTTVASMSDRLSNGTICESSSDKKSMNVSSTNSMSRQASFPDYVSGYVNTEIERPLPSRKVNEERNPVTSDEELDYDYPDIERTIRFNFGAPHQKSQKKLAALPPRKENNNTTTFNSALSRTTSSNSGNRASNANTPLPKWWLQLIEERERMRNNPDLYAHFATGRRSSQMAATLPPRQNLYTAHDQNASLCENSELLGIDTDDYIVMASAGCTVDDNYVNWETIYNAREYRSPHTGHTRDHKTLPPRKGVTKDAKSIPHRSYSVDDMQVAYIAMNTPPRKPAALPPRGVLRSIPDESKSECESKAKEKRTSVTEAPQMKPQVKPKPTSLVTKQKNGSLSQCHSNDSKVSEVNKPKPKPKPNVRPKPKIGNASSKPPLTRAVSPQGGEEKMRGQGQSQSISRTHAQHQDASLSPNRPSHPPVPRRSRPPRLSDQSATPSELALSTAK